jgi:flavin reductase (DIM6/NTAB) family NADH-FMN oxidoreductase RutF
MKKQYTFKAIMDMNPMYRRNLINTVSGYKSANLIGTLSHKKVPNVAIFNSIVHISASPPMLGFILRPLTVPRQTYHNILANKHFTVNAVSASMLSQAHQSSAKYGEEQSEFREIGLKPYFSEAIKAPYVEESPVKIGLQLEEEHLIKANGARLIIGRVEELILDDQLTDADGHVALEQAKLISIAGLDRYYLPHFLTQMEYARPGEFPKGTPDVSSKF